MTARTPRFVLAVAFLLPATTAVAQREGYSYFSCVGPEVSLVSRAEDDDERNALFLERGAAALEHRGSTTRDQATRIDTDDVTVVRRPRPQLRPHTGELGHPAAHRPARRRSRVRIMAFDG